MDPKEEAHWLNLLAKAPRVTTMLNTFQAIAEGKSGKPVRRVQIDFNLFSHDHPTIIFAHTLDFLLGTFARHFSASIPYSFEEAARLGASLLSYGTSIAQKKQRPARIYTTSSGDGVLTRALATLAPAMIETLTCSPNKANRTEFYNRGAPPNAHFFLGPYYEVTPSELIRRDMHQFAEGFDVIQEDTTFQMYHRDRSAQIALVSRNLKPGGILLLSEKIMQPSRPDYLLREQQKDQFKSLYFDTTQIQQKAETVLTHMESMQATLGELTEALQARFNAAAITFNSGNFYTIVASDDPAKLEIFISHMTRPAIPPEFTYHQLPGVLFGPTNLKVAFRKYK
jgi:tRNA (cmo5U34)-methyltransferase